MRNFTVGVDAVRAAVRYGADYEDHSRRSPVTQKRIANRRLWRLSLQGRECWKYFICVASPPPQGVAWVNLVGARQERTRRANAKSQQACAPRRETTFPLRSLS